MKLKNSKLKNTGILFELLVRQITTDTLNNQPSKAIDIIKSYFNEGSILGKEYKLYEALLNTKTSKVDKASSLIDIAIRESKKLNKSNLRREKYNLISEIRKHYDIEDFFKSRISNYKVCGSIYNIFELNSMNEGLDVNLYVNYKENILNHITQSPTKIEKVQLSEEYAELDRDTRLIAYKFLLEKFNSVYANKLDTKQKLLLKEYINNVTNSPKLKDYINSELPVVKTSLEKLVKKIDNEVIKIKIDEVISLIKPIEKGKNVRDVDVVNLLSYYQLISEVKTLN